jgi:hypothetical protein
MAKRSERKSSQRKVKTKPDAPGAAGLGDNSGETKPVRTPDEEREAFLVHRTTWNNIEAKRATFKRLEAEAKAALKADGFSVKQMKIADDLATETGEKKIQGEVKDRLQVARWLGLAMGSQLDLFEEPDRTPIVDRAYDAGKMASMNDKPAKPPHAPETEAYKAWMSGYHDHQATIVPGAQRDGGTAHFAA